MQRKIESLKRAVQYGIENGKRNLIVDLDVLAAVLNLTEPIYCEHGIAEGEWCEPCNTEQKRARIENEGDGDW